MEKKKGTFIESMIARIRLGKSPQESFGKVWLPASLDAVAVVQAGKIFLTTTEREREINPVFYFNVDIPLGSDDILSWSFLCLFFKLL